MTKKLFVYVISASKFTSQGEQSVHSAGVVVVNSNEDEATGFALRQAYARYPASQGWFSQGAQADEISFDVIAQQMGRA